MSAKAVEPFASFAETYVLIVCGGAILIMVAIAADIFLFCRSWRSVANGMEINHMAFTGDEYCEMRQRIIDTASHTLG